MALAAGPAKRSAVKMRSAHKAEIGPHNGRTAILVDGKAIPGMSCYTFAGDKKRCGDLAETGMPIFLCGAGPFWNGPGKYDFSAWEGSMARFDRKIKDCWFIARMNCLGCPDWWSDQHPDEVTRYAHAPGVPGESIPDWRNPRRASMASQKWISDVSDMLYAFVEHIEGGPYADRVLGYMINTGGSEEWVYWGTQLGFIPDYSPPALRYFKEWLGREYGHESWIDNVQVPLEPARRRGQPGMLRDPAKDRLAIDYELCLSDIVANCLLNWCSVVKQASDRKRLTGAFNSYLMWQTGLANALPTNGHLGLHQLRQPRGGRARLVHAARGKPAAREQDLLRRVGHPHAPARRQRFGHPLHEHRSLGTQSDQGRLGIDRRPASRVLPPRNPRLGLVVF
jgi:hypothetical protein